MSRDRVTRSFRLCITFGSGSYSPRYKTVYTAFLDLSMRAIGGPTLLIPSGSGKCEVASYNGGAKPHLRPDSVQSCGSISTCT
jgi:hypothetical protein